MFHNLFLHKSLSLEIEMAPSNPESTSQFVVDRLYDTNVPCMEWYEDFHRADAHKLKVTRFSWSVLTMSYTPSFRNLSKRMDFQSPNI